MSCLFASKNFCQSIAVGINTTTPNEKSICEAYAKNTGVLLPRLTTAERNQITVSASTNGLLIYNTDDKCFNFYRASKNSWEKMCGTIDNTYSKNSKTL